MSYDAFTIGLGANTGYTFFTPVGALIPRTSLGTEIELITYDSQVFRPANPAGPREPGYLAISELLVGRSRIGQPRSAL